MDKGDDRKRLKERVREELVDSFDEELEQELGDDLLLQLPENVSRVDPIEAIDRHIYFSELVHL